jgi:hypothetical protein
VSFPIKAHSNTHPSPQTPEFRGAHVIFRID